MRLAKYWVQDVGKSANWILEQAKNGMQFKKTNGGWHVHTASDLAIPANMQPPPRQLYGRALVHVVLLAFVCDKRPLTAIAAMDADHALEHTIKDMCNEMMCPSPTFASCLRSVMHPGLTQQLTDFAYELAATYGYHQVESLFNKHMSLPLCVQTHQHFIELKEAMEQTGVQFVQSPSVGHVQMPCGVCLSCHPTDHVLLFAWLLQNNATLIQNMQTDLSKHKGCGHKLLFDEIAKCTHT